MITNHLSVSTQHWFELTGENKDANTVVTSIENLSPDHWIYIFQESIFLSEFPWDTCTDALNRGNSLYHWQAVWDACQRNFILVRGKSLKLQKVNSKHQPLSILPFHLVFNKCLWNSSRNLLKVIPHKVVPMTNTLKMFAGKFACRERNECHLLDRFLSNLQKGTGQYRESNKCLLNPTVHKASSYCYWSYQHVQLDDVLEPKEFAEWLRRRGKDKCTVVKITG